MSRGICPRVNSCGSFWILSAVIFAAHLIDVDAYSCHEVKTAFQLRQVGPLHRVPETPGTDVDLMICKHQGPSCCTRKMEESYQLAVKRETLQNIQSYSYELEHLISGHSDAFQVLSSSWKQTFRTVCKENEDEEDEGSPDFQDVVLSSLLRDGCSTENSRVGRMGGGE
ncbi:hypothetical protein JOQ06_024421, partial [Pogonophryne albipinna]